MCAAQASLGIERQATWIIAENWWLVALRGVASILFGALAIAWPGLTLLVLVWLFGIYAATDGVFNIISGIRGLRKRRRDSILVLLGAAGIAAGITAIVWPEMTALLLVVLIGAWAMVTGCWKSPPRCEDTVRAAPDGCSCWPAWVRSSSGSWSSSFPAPARWRLMRTATCCS